MKQTSKIKIAVLAVCAVAGYFSYIGNQECDLNKLMLNNVEALASGENMVDYLCVGSGEVSCENDWVEVKLENYSLR